MSDNQSSVPAGNPINAEHAAQAAEMATTTSQPTPQVEVWRRLAIASLLALIVLCTGWELAWAPLRPSGSWWVLKVVPLLILLPGLLKSRLYSYQWGSMAILLYFMEGTVRATSDVNPVSIALAWGETALSTLLFCALLMYTRAFKRPKSVSAQTH